MPIPDFASRITVSGATRTQKQPTSDEKAGLLEELSVKLVTARAKLADAGNVVVLRRLNRREYRNTIRDLLGDSSGVVDELMA